MPTEFDLAAQLVALRAHASFGVLVATLEVDRQQWAHQAKLNRDGRCVFPDDVDDYVGESAERAECLRMLLAMLGEVGK